MTTVIYGIKNCDTVKKALRWLDDAGVDYRFHDFRVDGLEKAKVEAWVESEGWESVINRRSTSWKALSQERRDTLDDASAVIAVLETPTLVKRPVMEHGDTLSFGFKADHYKTLLGA
ncbi:MAG: ArsC family reductase [Pseudomonadota bacterium]